MKPQDLLKEFVAAVGKLIDARAITTETNLKAYVSSQINTAKKDLHNKIKNEIQRSEQRTRNEIRITRTELKVDINNLRTGVAQKLIEHDERLNKLEKSNRTPSKN